jgi:hypothetical protein
MISGVSNHGQLAPLLLDLKGGRSIMAEGCGRSKLFTSCQPGRERERERERE